MSIVYKHKPFENVRLRYAIVDQANVARKNINLYKKVKDITFAKTGRIAGLTPPVDIKLYDTIDQAMADSQDCDLIFLQSVGNILGDNRILQYLDEYYTANPDFFIVAFTLDWESEHGTGWVECHHQMMFINVHTWKKLGSPKYGGWETVTEELPNYSRSEENFHDRYTPYWMKGEPGTTIKTRSKQGSGFIKAAFENGVRIDNFTKEMRDCRLYVYPEHESDKLYAAFINKFWRGVDNPNQQKWIKRLNPKPTIWVYNSENYFFGVPNKKCTTYFGPSAGFKYLDILNDNDQVKFVFYDFHQKSVDWIKNLKENWDGNDFPGFMARQSDEFKAHYKYVNGNIANNQNLLFEDFGGEENFKLLWNKFKNCQAEFVLCNLFDSAQVDSLLSHTSGDAPFVYYSNIFSTDYTLVDFSLEQVKEYYDSFVDKIFEKYPLATTHGCNEEGTWVCRTANGLNYSLSKK